MMAPAGRRTGYSRKAQYGLFTGYVVASVGALIGAALLTISLIEPSAFGGLRGVANDAVAPVTRAAGAAREGGRGLIETFRGYLRAGSQNAALKEEMDLARIKLAQAKAVEAENARLKGLLGLSDAETQPVTTARLVGSSNISARRIGYLGAGRLKGVAVGMPVRTARGVVGRVLEVSARSARVLLLTDSQSVLPVRRAAGDVIAFAQGRGDGRIDIRLVNLGINPLKPGDVLVTSGAGGFYQPNLPVAIVEQPTDDGAIARVISDPAAADFVIVDPVYQPELVQAAHTPMERKLPGDAGPGANDGANLPAPASSAPASTAPAAPAAPPPQGE